MHNRNIIIIAMDRKGVFILDKICRKSIDFKEAAATIPLRTDVTR